MANKDKKTMIVGGGAKKVLYTLNTLRKIGIGKSGKALASNNTCKACGLGMGGQLGGMTNELNEYPSVCNKSIQAQSTDIQQAIPAEIFQHSVSELQELSGHELEHLGRIGNPLFKDKNADTFREVDWDWAVDYAAQQFIRTPPAKSFFYASGRSSNEAAFVFQLLARLYGTNNVNNCSYYCHQATSEGLYSSIGTGTSTVELEDLSLCDLVFVIGANPSSNHPRLIHKLKGVRDRGGQVVIINPAKEPGLVRFAIPKSPKSMASGGTWIASEYLQPRIGSDVALLKGIAKAVLEQGAQSRDFIARYTNNYRQFKEDIETTPWAAIEQQTGLPKDSIEVVAKLYAKSERAVFCWGMGVTHHAHGVENIEYIANLALLRGMMGKPGAGLLPLRGHSNVQGIGSIGVKPVLPEEVFRKIEAQFDITLPREQGLDTLACIRAADQGAINTALIMGGNLYSATPNAHWAAAALDKIDFKLFLSTTLNQGHVNTVDSSACMILPVTARDEEWQSTTQESMFNFVRLSDGGIKRHANTRPEVFVLSDLAKKILPECPLDFETFKEHQKVREAIANTVPGMELLADIGVAKKEFHVAGRLKHTPEFSTSDGRASFQVATMTTSHQKPGYPYTLMSIRSEGQFNSIIYEEKDSYRNTENRWSILLSQKTIEKLDLNSKVVDVVSPYGRMAAVTVYPFDLPEGDLMAYYPEANILIGLEQDPRSKTPAFKSVSVRLEYTD